MSGRAYETAELYVGYETGGVPGHSGPVYDQLAVPLAEQPRADTVLCRVGDALADRRSLIVGVRSGYPVLFEPVEVIRSGP